MSRRRHGAPLCDFNPSAAPRTSRREGLRGDKSVRGAALAALSNPFRDGRSALSRFIVAEYSVIGTIWVDLS